MYLKFTYLPNIKLSSYAHASVVSAGSDEERLAPHVPACCRHNIPGQLRFRVKCSKERVGFRIS